MKKLKIALVILMVIAPMIIGVVSVMTSQPAAAKDFCEIAADWGGANSAMNFLCFMEKMFYYMIFDGGGDW